MSIDTHVPPLSAPTNPVIRPPKLPKKFRASAAVMVSPRPPAPRDTRWWVGLSVIVASVLLVSFVAHAALFSAFQHNRDQMVSYDTVRASLAKAETPVGQLDVNAELVTPGTPVALLDIPAIGLSEVVHEGTTSSLLRSGPGHRRDSVMPGQVGQSVILGRQATYGGPFGELHRLVPGDQIVVTTGQGQHQYRVVSLRRDGDPMPATLAAGQGRLELTTADGLALMPSGALRVDAELVSAPQTNPSRVMVYAALPAPERAMGTDAAGWFAAFFSLVFFALAAAAVMWLWTTWGRWHAWLIGVPVLLTLGVVTADTIMNALPNLL